MALTEVEGILEADGFFVAVSLEGPFRDHTENTLLDFFDLQLRAEDRRFLHFPILFDVELNVDERAFL